MRFQKASTVSDKCGRGQSQKNYVKTKFQQASSFSDDDNKKFT